MELHWNPQPLSPQQLQQGGDGDGRDAGLPPVLAPVLPERASVRGGDRGSSSDSLSNPITGMGMSLQELMASRYSQLSVASSKNSGEVCARVCVCLC